MSQVIDVSFSIIFRILAIVLVLWFLYIVRDVIWLFLIAIIITAALNPITKKVQRLLHAPRAVAVSAVYILFFIVVTILIAFIVPLASEQFTQLGKELPHFMEQFAPMISMQQDVSFGDLGQQLIGVLNNTFSTTVGLLTGLISIVAVISMSFYMSLQKDGLKKALLIITPQRYAKYVASLIDRIQENFGRWMVGQVVTMIFVGVLYYGILTLFHIPYAPLLALIGGLLEIIPYFGPILATVPAAIFGFVVEPVVGVMVVASYFGVNLIENHFLVPKIMNKAVGLNPVLVILALLIGGKIAGVIGIFLAVPLAGAIGLFLKDVVDKKIT